MKTPAPPGTTLEPGRASRPAGRSWEGELGANQEVLARLLERGAQAAVRVDRPHEELAGAIAAEGPYDLVVDYLWGAPAEAVFTALIRPAPRAGDGPRRIRSIQVGIAAGEIGLDIDPVPLAGWSRPGRGPAATGASSSCPDGGRGPPRSAAPPRTG